MCVCTDSGREDGPASGASYENGEGEPRSMRFTFEFQTGDANPFFENEKLVKEFYWRKQVFTTESGRKRTYIRLMNSTPPRSATAVSAQLRTVSVISPLFMITVMPRAMRLLFVGLLLWLPLAAAAAEVRATLDRTKVQLGETVTLNISIEDGSVGTPDLAPLEQDFNVLGSSSNTSVTIVNGRQRAQFTYGVALRPKRLGRLYLDQVGIFPGSLGNYGGVHKKVPVVTIELPSALRTPQDAEVRQMWLDLLRWTADRLGAG